MWAAAAAPEHSRRTSIAAPLLSTYTSPLHTSSSPAAVSRSPGLLVRSRSDPSQLSPRRPLKPPGAAPSIPFHSAGAVITHSLSGLPIPLAPHNDIPPSLTSPSTLHRRLTSPASHPSPLDLLMQRPPPPPQQLSHPAHSLSPPPRHPTPAAPSTSVCPRRPRDASALDGDSDSSEDSTPLLLSSAPSSPTVHSPSHTRKALHIITSPNSPSTSSSPPSLSSSSSSSSYPFSLLSLLPRGVRLTLLFLTLSLLLIYFFLFPRIVLFATTGSFFWQPYAYYASRASAQRLYPAYFTADGNYSERAKNELALYTCPAPSTLPPVTLFPLPPPPSDGRLRVHVVASEEWTLFPWLWDSVLVNHTWQHPALQETGVACTATNGCHRCAGGGGGAECVRWFPGEGVEVVVVGFPIDLAVLPSIRLLLVVGENMEPGMFGYLRRPDVVPHLHPQLQLMAMMLMGEDCNSFHPSYEALRQSVDERLTYTIQTYGDCHLNARWHELDATSLPSTSAVDVANPIVYWPLGPKVQSGFPSRLPALELDREEEGERPLLLNLMVSINQEKSTRMQAWLVTTDYCAQLSARRCYVYNNDFVYKVVSAVERVTHLPLRSLPVFANPTSTEYLPLLLSSTFTLCPSGKNPEQYRIWEALMAGSIPIIEQPSMRSLPDMHAAYGATYRCTDVDVHRVLNKYKAPVLYVKDWRELPQLLQSMGEEEVREKRRQLKAWFRELKVELRRELFDRFRFLNHLQQTGNGSRGAGSRE